MKKEDKIYIAGHAGLIGSALLRELKANNYKNIITKTHRELDLCDQVAVHKFFKTERPEYVINAAAKVGGIGANISYPAQFIYENLVIQANIIHHSYIYGVKKLLCFGSACVYPRWSSQPIKEEYLLSGYLEPTNEPYAVAKIAGIKICEAYNRQYNTNFICPVPTNTYGPNDNFDPNDAHVVSALIRRLHEAKIKREATVTVWGTGNPRREFLYVDDLADACIFLMQHYNKPDIINIGTGKDISIKELAHIIKEVTGYRGKVIFDPSKPDGIPRKLLDISKLRRLGWRAKTNLREGITKTYKWYLKHSKEIAD
ncbi:MAG: GDP-L-fucose synthase [Candidatus Omnitrophota bacterium]|nr:GDP-L-fucose synthase [Candidatus Omnitrophota bacterium]